MGRSAILFVAFAAAGCGHAGVTLTQRDADVHTVDHYLQSTALLSQMPRAEDVRKLNKELQLDRPAFESALVKLLQAHDPRAPGRLVYSQVVQLGSFIDAATPLGKAAIPILGPNFPIRSFDGDRLIFAGDLYLWWRANRSQYSAFRPLREWESNPDIAKHIIPQYESAWRSAMPTPGRP